MSRRRRRRRIPRSRPSRSCRRRAATAARPHRRPAPDPRPRPAPRWWRGAGGSTRRRRADAPRPYALAPSDRIGDAGQFLGNAPEPALQILVVRLRAGLNESGMTTLFTEAIGAVVLAAEDVGVGSGPQRR